MPYASSEKWRSYRALFFIVLACAFFIVVGQTTLMSRSQGYDQLQQRSNADLNRYLLSLQQRLDRYKDLPGLLSSHSILINALTQPNNESLNGTASSYLQHVNDSINAADVYLMDVEGTAIAASNWSEERSFVGKNYAFRPYFKEAMAGKAGRYFALGTVSKRRG